MVWKIHILLNDFLVKEHALLFLVFVYFCCKGCCNEHSDTYPSILVILKIRSRRGISWVKNVCVLLIFTGVARVFPKWSSYQCSGIPFPHPPRCRCLPYFDKNGLQLQR